MTRVLLIAPGSDFNDQLERAFRDEDHEVVRINERSLAAWSGLWWVIRHVQPLRRLRNWLLAQHILRTARRFRPDLVLLSKGMSIKVPTLRALRTGGATVANWFPENGRHEPYQSWLDRHIGEYDLFFSFDSDILNRQSEFSKTRIVYLPLGVGADSFTVGALTSEDHDRYDTDICFVGACYPERVTVLSELTSWKLKIFGWKGWESTPLASFYGGPLTASESAKAYQCAKVVINMNLEPPVAGVNAKTFEICAAGGFQITDWRADLPKLFEEDREVIVFQSIADLKEKIARYLGDSESRKHIAQTGHERVMREHTMRHRVRAIISSL